MSSTWGIHVTAEFHGPVTFGDEWIERLYASLDENVAILSKDVFCDEPARTLSVFFAIDCPDGLDEDSLVDGIAEDALEKAIRFANRDSVATSALPILTHGRVQELV
jgi:hypothetical protein